MSRERKVLMKPGEDQNTSPRVLLPHGRVHSEGGDRPRETMKLDQQYLSEVSRGDKRMDISVSSSTPSTPWNQKERVSKHGRDIRERHPTSASGSSSHKIPKEVGGSKMKRKAMSGTDLETEKLLAELKRHEAQLSAALSRLSGEPAKFQQVSQICTKLQTAGMQLILSNLETATRQDIATRLWRAAHYPTTEVLRKQLQCTPEADAVKNQLMEFLTNSTQFYTTLIKGIQKTCKFQLSPLLAGKIDFQSKAHHRTVMMAIIVCHSCYICLGDLSRYQEQLSTKPDWSKPRISYLKAQQLAPKDGKPYNQLAIVAINAQRRLDAIYFYMRSLMAKNPFLSAHDSLVGLFEETSRKAKRQEEEEKLARERAERKAAERKRKLEKRRRQKKPPSEKSNRHEQLFSSGRKEIWIMPGREETERRQHVPEGGREEDGGFIATSAAEPESTPLAELTKRLVTTFLVAHGKLFTKIGIENFDAAVEKVLGLWQSVLQRPILLQDASRFIKMMVINIFSIHHAAERHSESDSAKQYYCGLGLSLAMQFTTTLLEACTKHLRQQPQSSALQDVAGGDRSVLKGDRTPVEEEDSDNTLNIATTSTAAASLDECSDQMPPGLPEVARTSADITSRTSDGSSLQENSLRLASSSPELLRALDVLSMLLPVVRVWFDWLAQQRGLWSQFVSHVQPTVLHEFGTVSCRFLNKGLPLCVEIEEDTLSSKYPKLWEDKLLAGFMPLKASLSTEDTFAIQDAPQLSSEQHRKQCLMRIVLMARTFRLLSDEGLLGIAYDPKQRDFSVMDAIAEEVLEEGEKKASSSSDEGSEPGSEESDSSVDEDVVVEGSEEEETDKTSLGIEQLKAQRKKLTKAIKQQHLALETQEALLSEAASKASQEVRVAPRYLVPDTNCFVDELPSIKTLLHSGCFTLAVPLTVLAELDGLSAGSSERENSTRVGSGAKSALAYINGEFSSKNAYLRALTTQGSLLPSLSFKSEVTDKASNDDLILGSCLKLHTKTDKRFTTKGGASEVYSVVLLTDDRNLRVKAHANNLPVRDIPAFMQLLA